jgi:hypothetical protein
MALELHLGLFWSPGFRISITCDAEQQDVRLSGMGVSVPERHGHAHVASCFLPGATTAYDRVDDRVFAEDVPPSCYLSSEL